MLKRKIVFWGLGLLFVTLMGIALNSAFLTSAYASDNITASNSANSDNDSNNGGNNNGNDNYPGPWPGGRTDNGGGTVSTSGTATTVSTNSEGTTATTVSNPQQTVIDNSRMEPQVNVSEDASGQSTVNKPGESPDTNSSEQDTKSSVSSTSASEKGNNKSASITTESVTNQTGAKPQVVKTSAVGGYNVNRISNGKVKVHGVMIDTDKGPVKVSYHIIFTQKHGKSKAITINLGKFTGTKSFSKTVKLPMNGKV